MLIQRQLLGVAIGRALDQLQHIDTNGGHIGELCVTARTSRANDAHVPMACARVSVKIATFASVRADDPAHPTDRNEIAEQVEQPIRY